MSEQIFAIGDVHGCFETLEQLLTKWNADNEQLIFIGDLIDRGEQSREVVQLAMKLSTDYGAVVIGGNHEDLLLEWLDGPMQHASFYYAVGGKETLASFFSRKLVQLLSPEELAEKLQNEHPNEIKFLRSLPDYVEYKHHIFVHAGINLNLSNWKNSGRQFFRSIREPFHQGVNKTGKTIVFGHTPTRRLHSDKRDDIWISDCKTKIGIDGAAVYGGKLHGLQIKGKNTYQVYSVDENLDMITQSFQL